jgi:hypothetical protein
MGKLLFWGVVGFGLYTAWAFSPVVLTGSQLSGAVRNVLEHGTHALPDEALRSRAAVAANDLDVPLDADAVRVDRSRRDGERTVRVAFGYPMTIAWLGERTLDREVTVEHTFLVDEEQEARMERERADRERAMALNSQRSRDHEADWKRQMRDECSKGGPDFRVSHLMVTRGKEQRMVDCSSTRHWPADR